MSVNKGPLLSRDELVAMQSDFRKKADFERERIYERYKNMIFPSIVFSQSMMTLMSVYVVHV